MTTQEDVNEVIDFVNKALTKLKELDPAGDNNAEALGEAEVVLDSALTELQAFSEDDEHPDDEGDDEDDDNLRGNGDEA